MANNNIGRSALLQSNKVLYQFLRPLIFTGSAQTVHDDILTALEWLDSNPIAQMSLKAINRTSFPARAVTVGGVALPHPFILAAGFVKGRGFESEQDALSAIRAGRNIIPGFRTMPNLVGAVEFGSFTRQPRTGNPGEVIWRNVKTRSTQNRVGLKNPGAVGAAAFLFAHKASLPPLFGINIAPSPGLEDEATLKTDVIDSMRAFIARDVRPTWFTLNLSCPNTEDDPTGRQTADQAQALTRAIMDFLTEYVGGNIPLWVKISPGLNAEQLNGLMQAFAETGVGAVIATNTLGRPAPKQPDVIAGVGGGSLFPHALETVRTLTASPHAKQVDVIACGGIQDPYTYRAFVQAGAKAVQYWSALVFRGPLAAALILNEIEDKR